MKKKNHYFFSFLCFYEQKNHFVLATITRTLRIFYVLLKFILYYLTMADNSPVWPPKLDENQIKDHSDIPVHHKTGEEVNKEVYTAPGDVSNVSTQKTTAEGNPSNDAPNSRASEPKSFSNESAVSHESANRPK
jgi:hypothetical protein